jgi:hypothetical protein
MVSGARTIDNFGDTERTIPASAIDPQALAGLALEKITGPTASGKVSLSKPAIAIAAVMSYVTATGDLVAVEGAPNVVNAFKLEGTHFSAVLNDPISGVATLTELSAADKSANTWVVLYTPYEAPVTQGGDSSVA